MRFSRKGSQVRGRLHGPTFRSLAVLFQRTIAIFSLSSNQRTVFPVDFSAKRTNPNSKAVYSCYQTNIPATQHKLQLIEGTHPVQEIQDCIGHSRTNQNLAKHKGTDEGRKGERVEGDLGQAGRQACLLSGSWSMSMLKSCGRRRQHASVFILISADPSSSATAAAPRPRYHQ